ncbi:MAG: WbqC family protein [Prevotella sp.]|nr:WbqC family protein [Prevotella sp.]
MNALLSTTYFGPVQWYQKLYRADSVLIERCESFQKQTYRNRCLIATTQGIQALTVPVERSVPRTSYLVPRISDIRISDHGQWRHLHWNALQSAYGESPFFEFYEDDLRPFFEPHWEFLLDYNEAIRRKMCELIDIQPRVGYTTEFTRSAADDFRDAIQPKHPAPDPDFAPRPYYQVYRQKHGFLPNLSILDLLMNMGPESIFYL